MDTTEGSAAGASPIFAMSGDGSQDVSIPMVFLFMEEAKQLLQALAENPSLNVRLEEKPASQQSDFGSEVEEEEVDGVKSPVHAFLKSNINVEMVGEDYVSVHTDEVTGEIVSSTVRTVQGPHGSSTKFKTFQKMKMGEIETLKSIGTAKIIKIEPSFKIEPVTQTPANNGQGSAQLIVDEEDIVPEEEGDVVLQEDEVHQENVVPHLLGSLVNTEDDLNKYQNMNLNEMDDVDEEVIDDTIEEGEEGEVEEVVEGEGEMFDILEDISSFLQPGSQEIKDIIDQTIASDPQLLSQLLSISFTDLVGAAEVIMKEKKSIKETYSTIFNQVQKMGADAFIESTKQKRRESTKLEESIVDLLGDGGVVELISEYLESVPDPDKKDRIQLLSTLQLTAQELDSKLRKGRNAH